MDREQERDRILSLAWGEALKWGTLGTATGTAVTVWGIYNSPWFNKSFGTSAKTSIPVMMGIFSWSLSYELTMNSAHRYPERWGLLNGNDLERMKKEEFLEKSLPLHKKFANLLYDHTFEFVGAAGTALAAKILNDNLRVPDLTFSQRIMHSRVFAQAGVLSILLPTMAFREFMDRRGGRFLE